MVTSLLKQLLYQLPSIPTAVQKAHDAWDKGGRRKRPGVDAFTEILIACSKEFSKGVFVLLDAFDECLNMDDRIKLVSHLQQLNGSGVKLYITTREQLADDLQRDFPRAYTIEISAQEGDVQLYLETKLSTRNLKPKLKEEIIAKIKEAAKGMYVRFS